MIKRTHSRTESLRTLAIALILPSLILAALFVTRTSRAGSSSARSPGRRTRSPRGSAARAHRARRAPSSCPCPEDRLAAAGGQGGIHPSAPVRTSLPAPAAADRVECVITVGQHAAVLLVIVSGVGAAMIVLGARESLLHIRTIRCPVCGHARLRGRCVWCRNR